MQHYFKPNCTDQKGVASVRNEKKKKQKKTFVHKLPINNLITLQGMTIDDVRTYEKEMQEKTNTKVGADI